jgi:hypothetical protein
LIEHDFLMLGQVQSLVLRVRKHQALALRARKHQAREVKAPAYRKALQLEAQHPRLQAKSLQQVHQLPTGLLLCPYYYSSVYGLTI